MIVNLAHVLRKQRRYEQAEQYCMTALSFAPSQAGTLAALAYTCLLQVCRPAFKAPDAATTQTDLRHVSPGHQLCRV